MYHPTTELHTLNRESQIAQVSGLTDRVLPASVKGGAGCAGRREAATPLADAVTPKLVRCIRKLGCCQAMRRVPTDYKRTDRNLTAELLMTTDNHCPTKAPSPHEAAHVQSIMARAR